MPLLVCPNCQSPMTEVARRGVYVDVCVQCRGVWLDGGELEKLLDAADAGQAEAQASARYERPENYRAARHDGDRPRQRRREGGVFEMFGDLFD